jgi:hypothetical protein
MKYWLPIALGLMVGIAINISIYFLIRGIIYDESMPIYSKIICFVGITCFLITFFYVLYDRIKTKKKEDFGGVKW